MSGPWSLDPVATDLVWPVADHAERPIRWRGLLPGVAGALGWLRDRGVAAGDRIGLAHPPSPAVAALLQAAPLAGVTLALLPTRTTPAEHTRLRRDLAVDRVLGHDDPLPERFQPGDAPATPLAPDPERTALVLVTSGTSARPKAVALSLRAILVAAAASSHHLGLRSDDRWLGCLATDHAGGAMIVYRSAISGCALRLHPDFDAARVAGDLDGVSGISLVPTMLRRILAERGDRPWPPSLRCILTGGGPLDPALRRACAARGRAPCHSYGLSEFAGMCCAQPPAGAGSDDSGRPLPGYTWRRTPEGAVAMRARAAFSGYETEGRVTRRHPADAWFATGDLAAPDSHPPILRLGDRREDLIVSGGENVSPAAVERTLVEHPRIEEAVVLGMPDAEWGQRVCAVVVGERGAWTGEALAAWLADRLAAHQCPKQVLVLPRLPLGPRGKPDRSRLRRLLAAARR